MSAPDPLIDWIPITAGPFRMGSDPRVAFPPSECESPRHEVVLEPFRLGRTAVTSGQYRVFIEETGHEPRGSWPRGRLPDGDADMPVTYVSFDDATAFCAWAGGRLPTETEWEAAASAGDGRLWPWGDELPDATRAVFARGIGCRAPVGALAAGASACGALDLAGNVGEWTSSPFRPYPFDSSVPAPGEARVIRGGSFIHDANAIRCAARAGMPAGAIDTYVGFRLAAACDASVDGVPLVEVPGGRLAIGRDPGGRSEAVQPDELPAADVWVAAFALGATLVTNAQYSSFVSSTGHRLPLHWTDGAVPRGLEAHPVVYVDYADASAFCVWAGVRLPTEAEWEKAARGADGRMYPAGERVPRVGDGTRPVGADLSGTGPYGHRDLAGNVWEWVASAYQPYPYNPADGRERLDVPGERVLRGGSYESPAQHFRCGARSRSWPTRLARHIGFRVARDLPI